MLGRIVFWIAVLAVVAYVAANPANAGATVHGWFTSAFTFIHALANG